ncbi:MAG: MqnA/MqnD/SBP family protein [Verrucomicrobiota bacterium]
MENRVITIGHSPDPDDAFMFYALTHGKLDTGGVTIKHFISDIETLNHKAIEGALEVTALSVHAYAYAMDKYALLTCGGSFGDGVGPIVVARKKMDVGEMADDRIAVPGTMTSAYLLLKLLLINFKFEVVPFDKIMDAVLKGEVDAGLLIHEGQLTYEKLGLHKIVDLGKWWQEDIGLPVPLGVNGVRKDLGKPLMHQLAVLMKQSIDYAMAHRAEAVKYAMEYGRGMDAGLTDKFVGMYVNKWTQDMGAEGRASITRLLTRGYHAALLPRPVNVEFVE